ncbi:MAG: 3-dehydroquinate synthase [Burkholderiaceae bacterium]|nr:3-dehydroquinate synthase [Burkholderiaceae bacterium]
MTDPHQTADPTAADRIVPSGTAPNVPLRPIFLVGMMGSGKTTIGRGLARALHRDFLDLDHELEARCGVRIPVIFEIEGEQGFRKRECQVLDECSRRQNIIMATGGGAVLAPENRQALRERGIVVYLRATVEELFRRTSRDRNRPLLATADPRATLRNLLAQREALYAEIADIVIDTGATSVGQIVSQVIRRLERHQQDHGNPLMHTVEVATPGGVYPIHIAAGRLEALAQAIPADATTIALVTNPVVDALYGERVRAVLATTGRRIVPAVLPDGESFKTWETLNQIFDVMLGEQLDRRTVIVALGGGVIGDMAGFAAAVYLRGVRFVQVPTTLLAQVDSSVGGKTAVNHPHGKNMIGAFYQPIAVEIDTDVLNTLPDREISAGLAEVIKYGLILDAAFLTWCEQHVEGLRARDPDLLAVAIRRSCEFKAWVVSRDERESGLREILNLGHTFGHAIEAGLGYGAWLHGEAVGCGLVMAADLSAELLGFPVADVDRVRALVAAIGCPVTGPRLGGADQWMALMRGDKKTRDGEITFVLMPRIGEAVRRGAPPELVARVIERNTR